MKQKLLIILILCFATISSVFAQSRKITGTVSGADDGQPIPGVSVKIQGSTVGTQTNVEGKFTLTIPANAQTLDVSFVGYAVQHIKLTAATSYNIKLSADTKQLTEVVVTDSYGVQSKKSYTGSQSTVTADALNDKPFSTPLEALQGQVAGLNVSQFSGQPGANIQVRLRGIGSISLDSNPLYVIDGMMITSGDVSRLTVTTSVLAGINEDDIESVTVLKDASATALYGARASNGVIVITTKKGKGGKAQVNFDAEVGNSVNMPLPDAGKPLSGDDYSTLFLEGLTNAGVVGAAAQAPFIASYGLNGPSNNWYNLVTRNGQQQQYNVSVRGGSDNTHVFASAGYFKQDATIIGSDLKRITGLLNVDQTISKSFSFATGLNFSNVYQDTPLNGGGFGNPVLAAYFLRPEEQPFNADGSYNTSRATNIDFPSTFNPLYMVQADKKIASESRVLGNITAKWNIWDQLKFTSYFSGDLVILEEEQYNNPIMGDGRTVVGRSLDDYTRYFNYLFRNQLDYRYNLNKSDDFYAEASIGYEAQKSDGYFISANSQGYPITQPLLTAGVNASTPITGNSTITRFTDDAFYTRAGINYKNRYSLTGSYRYEGSSKFGTDQPFGNFYSVGLAWNIDEEEFFKKQHIFSSLKFRTSYGSVGNSNGLGNYSAQITAGYGFTYAGLPGQNFNTIGNTALTWETSKPFDIGTDFSVLHDRLSFSFDFYNKKTDRLILASPTSRTTGFSSITVNVGAMTNTGEELSIKAVPIKVSGFQWNTNFNIALNKNTVNNLVSPSLGPTNAQQVGSDLLTWYARAYAGVNPTNGDALWYTDATKTTTTNNYNAATPIAQYQADPKVFGGWTNTFSYKGFSLSGDLYYNFGNYIFDAWSFYLNDGTNYTFNKYQYDFNNRWTTPGQITDVPKYIDGGGTQANGATYSSSSSFSSRFLYRGDFIRLKNLTLGYDFKGLSFLKKYGISKLYIYGRGTNIWTKTYDSRLPFDPEVGINGQSNLEIPIIRTYTVGINVGL